MLEVTWKKIYSKRTTTFARINDFLTWLLMELPTEIAISGWIIACQPRVIPEATETFSILIFCENNSEDEILKIIQQPPGEFKEHYVACVFSSEPQPVQEVNIEKHDDKDGDEEEEIVFDSDEENPS